MKAFTERNPKRIGAVVLVVVLALVAAVLLLNKSVLSSTYTVRARFANAAGIGPGATVTMAGVQVGTVSAVHLRGNAVVTDLAINGGTVLPHRTSAGIEVETVLGVLEVALQPISGWNRPLHSGALITDTTVPIEFQNLQNTSGKLLQQSDVAAFNQLLTAVSDIATGKQQQVAQIISGLDQLTGVVDARSSQVSQLIDAANTLASTVAARDQQLSSVVNDLASVVAGLAARSSDLATLIQQTDQMATQTASLVGQNQPQIQQLLDHLQVVLGTVSQHQEDLAQAVAYLDSGIQGFASIGYSGTQPNPSWANTYVNLLGSAGLDGILGACGVVDQALNKILGPDPLPCSQQTGPPITSTGPTSSGGTAAAGTPVAGTPVAGGTSSAGGSAAPSGSGSAVGAPSVDRAGLAPLSALLGQLVGS